MQLRDCCPGFDAINPDACQHFEGCGATRGVLLDVTTSDCIMDKECPELVDLGICERARARLNSDEFEDAGSSREVCQ